MLAAVWRAGLSALLIMLALPVGASAANRYAASSGGSAVGCPKTEPCSLAYAVTAAGSGDEVVVEPGTYNVTATIVASVPLAIVGETVRDKPRIIGAAGVTPLESADALTLRDLAIEGSESPLGTVFATGNGSIFDHLELFAHGKDALALRPGNNFTLTDSLLVAENGADSSGLFLQGTEPGEAFARNDTVIASGSKSVAIGLYVTREKPPTTVAIHAVNVIANAETDASAGANGGSTGVIGFDHSNLDTMTGGVTASESQTAPPAFVDAAASNFREAAGSPTIDAGINDPANGETDLDGEPRALPGYTSCAGNPPAVTDIGAYEYRPFSGELTCPAPRPVAPDTKITGAKINRKRGGARFRFSAVGAANSFQCKLSRLGKKHKRAKRPRANSQRLVSPSAFTDCHSPQVFRDLNPGHYRFEVRALNGQEPDPSPARRVFRI